MCSFFASLMKVSLLLLQVISRSSELSWSSRATPMSSTISSGTKLSPSAGAVMVTDGGVLYSPSLVSLQASPPVATSENKQVR